MVSIRHADRTPVVHSVGHPDGGGTVAADKLAICPGPDISLGLQIATNTV